MRRKPAENRLAFTPKCKANFMAIISQDIARCSNLKIEKTNTKKDSLRVIHLPITVFRYRRPERTHSTANFQSINTL